MTIGERIKFLRKEQFNLTQPDFGKKIEISSAAICKIENGDRNPSEQTIKLICREFNVNYIWLVHGKGEMFNNTDNITAKIDRILAGENETAKAVFRAFAELSEEEWNAVGNIINKLIEQKKKADTD